MRKVLRQTFFTFSSYHEQVLQSWGSLLSLSLLYKWFIQISSHLAVYSTDTATSIFCAKWKKQFKECHLVSRHESSPAPHWLGRSRTKSIVISRSYCSFFFILTFSHPQCLVVLRARARLSSTPEKWYPEHFVPTDCLNYFGRNLILKVFSLQSSV